MDKKILGYFAIFLSFVNTAAAQSGQIGAGELGQALADSFVVFLETVLGVNQAEEIGLVMFGAVFLSFWLLFHVIMAAVIDKRGGILKSLDPDPGHNESESIFTPLLAISFLGSIITFRTLASLRLIELIFTGGTAFIALATFMLFAGAVWALFNASSGAAAGIIGSSKSFKADMSETLAEANQDASEAAPILGNVSENPDPENVEVAIQDVEEAEHDIDNILKADIESLERTLQEAKEALEKEKEEEKIIENLETLTGKMGNITNGMKNAFEAVENGSYSGSTPLSYSTVQSHDFYGMGSYKEHGGLEAITAGTKAMLNTAKRLKRLEEDESKLVRDEIERLNEETKQIWQAMKVYKEIEDEVKQASDAVEYIENYAEKAHDQNIGQMASKEENQVKQMQQALQQIHEEEQRMKNVLIEIKEFLQNEVDLDDTEIRELKQEIESDTNLASRLQNLQEMMANAKGTSNEIAADDANDSYRKIFEDLGNAKKNAEKTIEYLEETLERKENEERIETEIGERIENDLLTKL